MSLSADPGGAAPAWPAGVARVVLDEVDSTMADAARRAPGLAGPAWILARRQTAARGRRGRPWVNPEGNFAATLVFRPTGDAASAARQSFVAALALADVLAALAPAAEVALKWPNDVLVAGRKVSGILLESAGAGRALDHLAIGIGVNLAHAPPTEALDPGALPAIALAEVTGTVLPPEAFLDRLAPAVARWQAVHEAEGFAPIRAAWLARAARLGETITARTGRETLTGRFEGLDDTGALVLATPEGTRAIPAADIHLPAPRGPAVR